MTDDGRSAWEETTRRTYEPADRDRPMQYVTYVHESGDCRLRLAPASLDGADYPGYALTVQTYPGLDIGRSIETRRVLSFDRCVQIAERFMSLFDGRYDGPATLEDAIVYAHERVRAPAVTDQLSTVDLGAKLDGGERPGRDEGDDAGRGEADGTNSAATDGSATE